MYKIVFHPSKTTSMKTNSLLKRQIAYENLDFFCLLNMWVSQFRPFLAKWQEGTVE